MSRFRVTSMDGDTERGGVDNRAIEIDRSDPVQLSAYGLYTKRDSSTNPPATAPVQRQTSNEMHQQRKNSNTVDPAKRMHREPSRKISLGIAQWTR